MATTKKTTTSSKKTTSSSKKTSSNGLPLLDYKKIGGDIKYDDIVAPQIDNPGFTQTDTNFDVDQVSTGNIAAGTLADRFMTAADYAMVDPSEVAKEYGDINRSEMEKNAGLSSKLALDALNTELQGLQNFAPAASALKRRETALDNTFNQGERDRQIAAGDPNLKADLEGQRNRANAYAEGRVPDSIQDRALELGIRSRAAEGAAMGGFGVNSSAARKASELMSAEQRIQLSQYGDQALTSNIQNRSSLLLAPTQYSDAGSQIQVSPSMSAGQTAMAIASEANQGNITAKDALSNKTQQEQFQTSLQQETNSTNVNLAATKDLNQAQLNLQADTSTASNKLSADTTNANNNLQAQTSAATIRSNESQFTTQLEWNTNNANAERTSQTNITNASNRLSVAQDNRSTQLQIQTTNKNMIFQDQQQRKQLAASAAANAASNATSRANAALSYKSQQDAIAANAAEKNADRQFQLSQQQQALDIYKEQRGEGQSSTNAGAVGNMISRAPAVISGVTSLINAGTAIYGLYNGGGTTISAETAA